MAKHLPCPRCQERGGDTSGDNLQVYDDGAFCHACRLRMSLRQLTAYMNGEAPVAERSDRDTQAELALIQTFPVGAPHKPHLPMQFVQEAGIRYSVDDQGNPDAVYYPYKERGQLVDYKKRLLSEKRFYCITGKINRAELFNEDLVPPRRRKLLIITEGEDDKVAARALLSMEGCDYQVVSVQNGANDTDKPVVDKTLVRRIEFLEEFQAIALCFDNDTAGKKTAKTVAEWLAPRLEVRIIELPPQFKDADEMLKAGQSRAFKQALWEAKRFVPEGIMEARQVTIEMLQQPSQKGFELLWPALQYKLHGLRKAEITLLTGGTGAGKTTYCRELDHLLIDRHGLTTGNIYLEEQWIKTAQGLIAIDNNVPLPLLRENPHILTPEQWKRSHDKFYGAEKAHHMCHFGSIASDSLIAKMRYMVYALGCDFIFLDHVTMVLSGQESNNERKDIDILMTRLAELVTETGVGVIPVVHLKRSDVKAYERGEEIALADLRGSSQLECLSFNIIAIERDQQGTMPDVSKIRLLKNREWGYTGVCDRLIFDHKTGRQYPAKL